MARVLVTRAMPEAGETARMLVAAGHDPILAPLSIVEALPLPTPLPTADRLIATSRNAFLLARDLGAANFPADWLNLPLHGVGPRTAEAARAAGFRNVFAAAGEVGALIKDLRTASHPGERLLYLAGETRRPELEEELGVNPGFAANPLRTVVNYRITRVQRLPDNAQRALESGACDAVLHFSAESAAAFFDLVEAAGLSGPAAKPAHACLSAAVAERVESRLGGAGTVRIAKNPGAEALIALLRADSA
jgi:uroporphyrinogen-III synthase